MTGAIYAAVFLLSACTADYLTIRWHRARERRQVGRAMALSAVIEAINWAPIVAAINSDVLSPAILAGLNIAGTVIGTGLAMRRAHG